VVNFAAWNSHGLYEVTVILCRCRVDGR